MPLHLPSIQRVAPGSAALQFGNATASDKISMSNSMNPMLKNIFNNQFASLSLLTALIFAASGHSFAQQAVNPALRPPKGSQVAIVVFEDLQCPDCRRASPLVEEAGRTYKIPVIFHDFPLPMHNWSFDAAIIAR